MRIMLPREDCSAAQVESRWCYWSLGWCSANSAVHTGSLLGVCAVGTWCHWQARARGNALLLGLKCGTSSSAMANRKMYESKLFKEVSPWSC